MSPLTRQPSKSICAVYCTVGFIFSWPCDLRVSTAIVLHLLHVLVYVFPVAPRVQKHQYGKEETELTRVLNPVPRKGRDGAIARARDGRLD